jgi:hypothetical protein
VNRIQIQDSWNDIVAMYSFSRDSLFKGNCCKYLSFLLLFPHFAYGAEHDVIRECAEKTISQICLSDNITFYDSQTRRERRINQGLNILIDGNEAKVLYDLTAYEHTAIMDLSKKNKIVLFNEHKEFLVAFSNMVDIVNKNAYTNSFDSANGNWTVHMLVVYKDTNKTATSIQYNLDLTTSVAKMFRLLAEQKQLSTQ